LYYSPSSSSLSSSFTTTTQLEIVSKFGDPAPSLETVNGTVAEPPQLVDPSTMTPETTPPLPFAGEVKVETGTTTTTTTTMQEPPPKVVEEVKVYKAAPLAQVEDSSKTTTTTSQRTPLQWVGGHDAPQQENKFGRIECHHPTTMRTQHSLPD
jgi:hypothetical protein